MLKKNRQIDKQIKGKKIHTKIDKQKKRQINTKKDRQIDDRKDRQVDRQKKDCPKVC